jgi:hypothetical protein
MARLPGISISLVRHYDKLAARSPYLNRLASTGLWLLVNELRTAADR